MPRRHIGPQSSGTYPQSALSMSGSIPGPLAVSCKCCCSFECCQNSGASVDVLCCHLEMELSMTPWLPHHCMQVLYDVWGVAI